MSEPKYGRTRSGVVITDELIERWAAEAEAGFDVEQSLATGRSAGARLLRIGEAHTPRPDEHGGMSGYCPECDIRHPCPTLTWATTKRDWLAPWDPDDDEVDQ